MVLENVGPENDNVMEDSFEGNNSTFAVNIPSRWFSLPREPFPVDYFASFPYKGDFINFLLSFPHPS